VTHQRLSRLSPMCPSATGCSGLGVRALAAYARSSPFTRYRARGASDLNEPASTPLLPPASHGRGPISSLPAPVWLWVHDLQPT
jgi:hypothetical protein